MGAQAFRRCSLSGRWNTTVWEYWHGFFPCPASSGRAPRASSDSPHCPWDPSSQSHSSQLLPLCSLAGVGKWQTLWQTVELWSGSLTWPGGQDVQASYLCQLSPSHPIWLGISWGGNVGVWSSLREFTTLSLTYEKDLLATKCSQTPLLEDSEPCACCSPGSYHHSHNGSGQSERWEWKLPPEWRRTESRLAREKGRKKRNGRWRIRFISSF